MHDETKSFRKGHDTKFYLTVTTWRILATITDTSMSMVTGRAPLGWSWIGQVPRKKQIFDAHCSWYMGVWSRPCLYMERRQTYPSTGAVWVVFELYSVKMWIILFHLMGNTKQYGIGFIDSSNIAQCCSAQKHPWQNISLLYTRAYNTTKSN